MAPEIQQGKVDLRRLLKAATESTAAMVGRPAETEHIPKLSDEQVAEQVEATRRTFEDIAKTP